MEQSISSLCVFCSNPLDNGTELTVLREKGCDAINKSSTILNAGITTYPGQKVHKNCRRDFCRHKEIRRYESASSSALEEKTLSLRSKANAFSFKDHCLFCSQLVKNDGNKRSLDCFPVRTFDFQRTITSICSERGDDWANEVSKRIEFGRDLPAVDAVYHQVCNVNFRTGKQIPKQLQSEPKSKNQRLSVGRPENLNQANAFLKVVEYLENNDDEQVTISDLVIKMQEYCSEEPYSFVYMKKKLLEYFGKSIIIAEINGKQNVVTFRSTASEILHNFYSQPKDEDLRAKQIRIIETAAKLLRSDIKDVETNRSTYPDPLSLSSDESNLEFLPGSLKCFLTTLFGSRKIDTKVSSIGQTIMQAVRPRVLMAPLQIGLAVQLHHHFASKFLIDVLNSLGFCASYFEVSKFESSAAVSKRTYLPDTLDDGLIQFSADNVDHNLLTLDGSGTFHGMGIIASITPGVEFSAPVPRVSVTSEEIIGAGKIDIKYYKARNETISPFLLEKLKSMQWKDETANLETLLKISWPLQTTRLGWSGFMQSYQKGNHPGQSSICFLPMIDMNPSDLTCIYSTLLFICKESSRLSVTPTVTFDQPLYWKALTMIHNEPQGSPLKAIVLRLGGFHMQMSFLGCIGFVMQNSGLYEVLENIYASNTIEHMLTGKSFSRSLRGHMIVDSALHILLISNLLHLPTPCNLDENTENTKEREEEIAEDENQNTPLRAKFDRALEIYHQLLHESISIEDILENAELEEIEHSIKKEKERLSQYPTAKLWIQYTDMIYIMKCFIKAERTGNWQMHLETVKQMLPYFAASGHNLYLKSAYTYVQQMQTLRENNPEIFLKFCEGYHVVRRSSRYWAGLPTDLIIEQTLMRSVKTTGGMTRGKGMSEVQRAQWLLSMPACSSINSAMQDFEKLQFSTSDQHKECSRSRQERDNKDLTTVLSFLLERNPFIEHPSLRNIETGVTASKEVNVHKAQDVGQKIIEESMEQQNVFQISFKRSKQVKTLNEKSKVKVQGDNVSVSPQLLFQRLVTAARSLTDDVAKVFSYELSNYPSSMFDTNGIMREPQKSNLADALWVLGNCSADDISSSSEVQYVLDGGSLLHHMAWIKELTFGKIAQMYADHVRKKYGTAIIVFDGYDSGPSTKDQTHNRRTKGVVGNNVIFNEDTPFRSKKELFLRNSENKKNFIKLLSDTLQSRGCTALQADGDADLLIVQTTVASARNSRTVLVGEDTDLLVLLCYHANPDDHDIIFKSDSKPLSKKFKVWDLKKLIAILGKDTCTNLLFVHALTGCDTTSRLFGVGKGQALKKAIHDPQFKEIAHCFGYASTKEEIRALGERAIGYLYGAVPLEGLDLLRFRKFYTKVMSSSTFVEVHTLPPTADSAKFHSYRVFYQVKQWMGEDGLDLKEWGWAVENDECVPVRCSLPPAPEELLKTIYCKCKTACDTKRCTCKKHGLECSVACTECHGTTCCNSSGQSESEADMQDDEQQLL